MTVYRQISDLVSVVGNRAHMAYFGRKPDEYKECRTRPKDFLRLNLRLPGEITGTDAQHAGAERLPCGNLYLAEINVTVGPELFLEARAYKRLFQAMGTPMSVEEFDRILLEHPELLQHLPSPNR